MRKIIAISANTKPVRYVMSTSNRPDGKIAAELTANKDQAFDFVTMDNACRIIEKIVNPFERVYMAEEILINRSESFINSIDDYLN